ncbi:hypothetical protein REPUB_Repub17cG0069600 [Reevesia pubescens]
MGLECQLFKKSDPIPANSTDHRWKWIKVATADKPRYRTHKGDIATNMLDVCTPDMQFVYVLPGWKESMADGRVL